MSEKEADYQQALEILRVIVQSDGIGDYLEMGIQCNYCSWVGSCDEEPVHDPECIILKAQSLLQREGAVQHE